MENVIDVNEVVIAWNSRKRHLFINKELVCNTKHTSSGYSPSNGQYSSYVLDFPNYNFKGDTKYTHLQGIIPFIKLDDIPNIIKTSICKKCQRRYDKLVSISKRGEK